MYPYFGMHSISVFVTCDRGVFILGFNVDNNIQEYKGAYNSYLGGGVRGQCPPIFFYLRIMFLATELKTGHIKELGKCGEDGCMYINPYPANVENMVSS